jgi:hypothetical protein
VSLAAAAIASVVKANEKEDHLELARRDEGVVSRDVPCEWRRATAGAQQVEGKVIGVPGASFVLGTTDAEGRLEIDLMKVSAVAVRAAPEPKLLVLYIGEARIGQASLADVERAAEEKAWSDAEIATCMAPTNELSCLAVEQFIRDFPDSRRVAAARGAIERGREVLREREMERAAGDAVRAAQAERDRREQASRESRIASAASAARRAAAASCAASCAAACGGKASCKQACVERSCEAAFLPGVGHP